MQPGNAATTVTLNDKADGSGNKDALVQNRQFGNLLVGSLTKIALPSAVTDPTHPPLTLYFDDNTMQDLWIAITWSQ
jgi:hypothetical protein